MYRKIISSVVLLAGIGFMVSCGNHAGPSADAGHKDSSALFTLKDDTLSGFLLGAVYFFQGYGGTEKTYAMVKQRAAAVPGDKMFTLELDKAYTSLMVLPYRRSPQETPDSKKALGEWWNVHNKQQFDTMLVQLKAHGHQELFERCKKALDENGGAGASLAQINLQAYGLTAEHSGSLGFLKEHYTAFSPAGIKAWDIARYISNVCMGYSATYLERAEALQLVMTALAESRRLYPDWNTYYKDFILGRQFWGGDKANDSVFAGIIESMQRGDYSIFKYLPLRS
jgi:hypothetical protein